MEETLAFQKMEGFDLIKFLESISSKIHNRILQIEGFIIKDDQREELEIIIFKGFSSSTTHQIEIDLEKKIIEFSYVISLLSIIRESSSKSETT